MDVNINIEKIENKLEDIKLEAYGGTIDIIDKEFDISEMVNKLNTLEEIKKHIKENDRNIQGLDEEFIDKWRRNLETYNETIYFCEMMKQLISLSDFIFNFSYTVDEIPTAYSIALDCYEYQLNTYKTYISHAYTNSNDIKKTYSIEQDYIYITCIKGHHSYNPQNINFISTSENFYDVFRVEINNEYTLQFELLDMVKIMYTSLSENDVISRIKKIDKRINWSSEIFRESYSNYVQNYREYLDTEEY